GAGPGVERDALRQPLLPLLAHYLSLMSSTEAQADARRRWSGLWLTRIFPTHSRGGSSTRAANGLDADVLRRVDGAWKIARRKLVLDQNVLLAKNVSIFF